MGACVAIGVAVGWWIDKKLGTDPWFTVVGTLFGSAAAIREMLRMVNAARREEEDEASEGTEE